MNDIKSTNVADYEVHIVGLPGAPKKKAILYRKGSPWPLDLMLFRFRRPEAAAAKLKRRWVAGIVRGRRRDEEARQRWLTERII